MKNVLQTMFNFSMLLGQLKFIYIYKYINFPVLTKMRSMWKKVKIRKVESNSKPILAKGIFRIQEVNEFASLDLAVKSYKKRFLRWWSSYSPRLLMVQSLKNNLAKLSRLFVHIYRIRRSYSV